LLKRKSGANLLKKDTNQNVIVMSKTLIMYGNQRPLYLAFAIILLTMTSALGQQSVTGVVRDIEGQLAGVSIIVKRSNVQAISNAEGRYRILADVGDTLVFRNVGYMEKEIVVPLSLTIDVVLASAISDLDEVVVVGYGTQTRRNVTGSVSKVDMAETENLPNTNVGQALRGRVAGVQFTDNGRPGQSGSILIRGPRSLSAGNSPLIVLDGIFFNGSLDNINSNDIESMEILKDASAAAIYGSRAANGVILITSKRGKTEKPTVNVNTFYGLSDWVDRMQMLSPERYLEKSMEIRRLEGVPFDPDDPTTYLTLTEAENYRNGKVTDPFDMISQQGRIFSADASLSGKSQSTNYYLSASTARENGLVLDDNSYRTAFRVNLDNKITDWLTLGTNTMFSEIDNSGVPPNLTRAQIKSPFGNWFREDGSPAQFILSEEEGAATLNPLYDNYLATSTNFRTNLFANFYTIVDIPGIKGLTFRVNYSANYRWIRDYQAQRNDPHLPNANTSSASKRNWKAHDWVLENILDYKFKLADNHTFDITLMYGANEDSQESTTASADQLEFDAFGYNRLNVGELQTVSSSAQQVTGISSMARLNYRFKDRYLFTLTARRDGSSVFAANNKFATLPSAAFAWIASDESFLQDVNFLDLLKIRTSYGVVGNQAISPYQSVSLASITRYVYGDVSALGIYPSNIANDDLKWETTYTTNLAADFELFKGRIGGTVEVYDMDTRDLLVERTIPIMTGYSSIWTNLGRVNNRGVEFSLNTVNIRKEKFEWSSSFVFSHNRNKIVSLYGTDADGDGREDDDISNRWFIGHPITVFYDYVFDGIYQEGDELPTGYQAGFARFRDLNGDGQVEAEHDRTIVGQGGQPRYRWGITNNFRYGNFDFSIFINAMQGWIGTFNDMDFSFNSFSPMRPVNIFDFGWWTPENQSNTRPSLAYRQSTLGHNWYSNRSFIRIQDISLAYSFPSTFLTKHSLSNLSMFLSGKNLWTFTDWLGTNPESISADRYPIAKSYTLGFRIGF